MDARSSMFHLTAYTASLLSSQYISTTDIYRLFSECLHRVQFLLNLCFY